jgi:hypothetical protein
MVEISGFLQLRLMNGLGSFHYGTHFCKCRFNPFGEGVKASSLEALQCGYSIFFFMGVD